MTLLYPASGSVSPRWYPIYGTNNWTGDPYFRNEWEAAFPTAVYWNGSWRIIYTATYNLNLRNSSPNYDRLGRIDLPSLTSQPSSLLQQPWSWIPPIDASCQALGSCTNQGSGFPNATTIFFNLYVYHRDGNYAASHPGCNLVRHRIQADANLTPTFDGCIGFDLSGLPSDEVSRTLYPGNMGTNVYDVATAANGNVYLLTSGYPFSRYIDEFVSTNAGRTFHYSGVTFRAANFSPRPGQEPFATDAAYLTDLTGRIVEPRVIVGLVGDYLLCQSPGNPPGCGEPGQVQVNGTWKLYCWAYAGAVLPPSWGTDAPSCQPPPVVPAGVPGYQGNFDGTSCQVMDGWVWDWYQPNTPINVDIYDNGTFLASVPASTYRPDLPTQGYFGNANHGFSYNLPAAINNGQAHTLSARYGGTAQDTSNSPRTITCPQRSSFFTVTPCRVADTRNPNGPFGGPALAANTTRNFAVGGQCGIPADAKSVSYNITVAGATAQGDLRLYPGGAVPLAWAHTYSAGQTRANNAVIALGAGQLAIRCDQASGSAHVIIDVSGYFK